jgi:organic radical activating enzyme
LPLVKTGCDSYSSVYPEFKKFVMKDTADQLAKSIVDLLPHKTWQDEHLVITGGEPLLGWQRAYPELLEHPLMQSLQELTFETNGTQELTGEFFHYLMEDTLVKEITFSVSPKLSVSGEKWSDAIKPDIVCDYNLLGYTYLKFVVAGEQDTEEILEAVNAYRNAGFTGPVYLMPVGGVESVYELYNKNVALLAMKHGFRYSDRLQVPLFKNLWGT